MLVLRHLAFLSLTKNIAINPPIKMKINDDHKVPISPMIGIEKLGKYEPSTQYRLNTLPRTNPLLKLVYNLVKNM